MGATIHKQPAAGERGTTYMDNVVVVPEEEGALGDLKVGRGDTLGEGGEEGASHCVKLLWANQLQHLLQLVQHQHLLARRGPGPVPNDALNDRDARVHVLLHILGHAVGQLLVVQADALWSVQGQQGTAQEDDMLLLQRESKPARGEGGGLMMRRGGV